MDNKSISGSKFSFIKLRARTFFKSFEKMQANLLYWFAAQRQTSTSIRQKVHLFYVKFSAKFNKLSLFF